MVHTAGLRGIHYSNAFHPSVPLSGEVSDIGPAVTIGAGVMTGELYESAAALGYTVVGGSCKTVGIAGGWMQSGGYGILSPSKGLGVDNVVEFGLVTATVSAVLVSVIATAC
jgi:FAD/FMN-containing dehydrogenase